MRVPVIRGGKNIKFDKFLSHNKNYILQKTFFWGAVLFRDFDMNEKIFENGINSLNLNEYKQEGSAAPRTHITGSVYTANDSPPSEKIPMHHELAQNLNPPSYIFFSCETPSVEFGETPIVNSRNLLLYVKNKHNVVYEKLKKGVYYSRIMSKEDNPNSSLGRGWKNTFGRCEASKLEEFLVESNMGFEWMENEILKVKTSLTPAIRKCHRSNRETFFNSIIAAYTGWNDVLNNGKEAVQYYDNSYIEEEFINDILNYIEKEKIQFKWKKGDVLMIDNTIMMHSRNTYIPPRKLYTTVKGFPNFFYDKKLKTLPSWDTIPLIHFGTQNLDSPKESVMNAILLGYEAIDCASINGNEKEIGEGIKYGLKMSNMKREDIFITSKLWSTYNEHVKEACQKSLEDLKLKYLDLYLIHSPVALQYIPFGKKYPPEKEYQEIRNSRVPIQKVWFQMEELVKKGLVKNIGVCNFPVSLLRDMLSYCTIPPSVAQFETYPENTQLETLNFCKENDIHVSTVAPFGKVDYMGKHTIFENEVVKNISEKYNCSPAQLLLSWARMNGFTTVTECNTFREMKEYSFHTELSRNDFEYLHTLNSKQLFY